MSANAPYYQMRASQIINATNVANAVQPPGVPEEGSYDLPASAAVASPHEQAKSPMYTKPTAFQSSANHNYEDSHNFAELLEAASSVATGEAAPAGTLSASVEEDMGAHSGGQKKRASSSSTGDVATAENSLSSKRRRVQVPTDPQLQEVDHGMYSTFDNGVAPQSRESLLDDACTAGVHSAAALFRRSSERASRKYTRPPMSKLFVSLQLSPENFLQLQAQAKAYMLDATHPERQNCVGNRGKGDTDMVKLRLFHCVRAFLNEKAGEQFFGEHVDKPGERESIEAARALGEERALVTEGRLTWPRDGNKIISLVTPLMRRMVTNERQRQYAIETRKGSSKKGKAGSEEAGVPQAIVGQDDDQQMQSPLDPKLAQQARRSHSTSPSVTAANVPFTVQGLDVSHPTRNDPRSNMNTLSSTSTSLPTACSVEPNLSHINIFLVVASRSGKPSIKLGEKRLFAERPAHLTFYDWNDFLKDVHDLLSQAQSRYPELRRQPLPHEDNIGSNNLRGLAAAANALQSEVTSSDHTGPFSSSIALHRESAGSSSVPSSSGQNTTIPAASTTETDATLASQAPPSSSRLNKPHSDTVMPNTDETGPEAVFPRHIVKTIGPSGWSVIDTEQDWYHVLREKAFAVWADGVCNVLVELVDAPAEGKLSSL